MRTESRQDEPERAHRPDEADIGLRHQVKQAPKIGRFPHDPLQDVFVEGASPEKAGDFARIQLRGFTDLLEPLAKANNSDGLQDQAKEKNDQNLCHGASGLRRVTRSSGPGFDEILVADQFNAEFFDLRLHARTAKGFELVLMFILVWMTIDLERARPEVIQQFYEEVFRHPTVLQKSEHTIRVGDAPAIQCGDRPAGQAREDCGVRNPVKIPAGAKPEVCQQRIAGQPHRPNVPRFEVPLQHFEYGGVQVEVQMPIHMIEQQSGQPEFRELRIDLLPDKRVKAFSEVVPDTRPNRSRLEFESLIHQPDDFTGFKDRFPTDEHQVNSDAEIRIFPGKPDGSFARATRHHETRRRQNALAVRPHDGSVCTVGYAEIVAIDDEADRWFFRSHGMVFRCRTGRPGIAI